MFWKKIKDIILGRALNPKDQGLSHKMSLVAFFAWVGLGADGLSSSCYGPEEAFLALQGHQHLSIFVALATVLTVFIISASYTQIIELFSSGGGGYLVASKLLSPNAGMVAGSALLIDYLLTITISIASGTDAIFSFLPPEWLRFKLEFAVLGVLFLTILNMRGMKESILPLVPIFLTFVISHVFIILYAIFSHTPHFPILFEATHLDIQSTRQELGLGGMLFIILRAYGLGAGTYTGIEAVSNGIPILREPRVKTGKRTMLYMSTSLAFTVMGIMLAYLFYNLQAQPGKTLNAVLFEAIFKDWGTSGYLIVLIILLSEAMILFVAAQAGFIGGPRVLANMAVDRWFPSKFASLSDRLVNQKGILLMGIIAMVIMTLTGGSVKFLVVLYSINVFITFCLSLLGMVRYWWQVRFQNKKWLRKILVSGTGFFLSTIILISVVISKFHEGGWITLAFTGSIIALSIIVKRHYLEVGRQLHRLNALIETVQEVLNLKETSEQGLQAPPVFDPQMKTAVLMVNGFNGLGLHCLFNIIRLFGKEFKNFVFIQIGVIDAGNFKGVQDVGNLEESIKKDVNQYVTFLKKQGYYAEGLTYIGIDVIDETEKIVPQLIERFPNVVFFGGQLVFSHETIFTKWLHNYTVFAMQKILYNQGIPFLILPVRV